jgi:RNA polymerase sigma-70 factor, ECF subfamily
MTTVSMTSRLVQRLDHEDFLETRPSKDQRATHLMRDTESYLPRIAAGDDSALEGCMDRYGALIWSLARRFSSNPIDSEDALQEILLEIWTKAGRWDPTKSSEVTFITMIARRKLIDRFRKQSRSLESASLSNDFEISEATQVNPVELLDESEKATRCLERLNENQRTVIEQSIHKGLSHQKIALGLGIPVGTVKTFARRGLIQLRNCMELQAIGRRGS